MEQIENWDKLSWIDVDPGVRRKVLHGETCTVALVELAPGAPAGLHSHPHEQLSTIRSGEAAFILGENTHAVGPGDVVRIPPDVRHGVRVLGNAPVTILDFFVPKRADFTPSEPV